MWQLAPVYSTHCENIFSIIENRRQRLDFLRTFFIFSLFSRRIVTLFKDSFRFFTFFLEELFFRQESWIGLYAWCNILLSARLSPRIVFLRGMLFKNIVFLKVPLKMFSHKKLLYLTLWPFSCWCFYLRRLTVTIVRNWLI